MSDHQNMHICFEIKRHHNHFVLSKNKYLYIPFSHHLFLPTCDSCLGNLGLYLSLARPINSGSCFVPMELKWMTVIVAGFLASKTGGWNELLQKVGTWKHPPKKALCFILIDIQDELEGHITGWWFQIFCMFIPIWGRFPF